MLFLVNQLFKIYFKVRERCVSLLGLLSACLPRQPFYSLSASLLGKRSPRSPPAAHIILGAGVRPGAVRREGCCQCFTPVSSLASARRGARSAPGQVRFQRLTPVSVRGRPGEGRQPGPCAGGPSAVDVVGLCSCGAVLASRLRF